MTRLRQMMLEELQRRNYSPGTIRCYLRAVADFARYFHRSPDQLRPQHIREYQACLFRQRKLDASSVTQKLAALRFFFIKTLKKSWSVAETPYPKQVRRLPTILSQEEVARLINSARNPFDRVLLMTLYATGARCAEAARLQVGDIDSRRMVVHIRGGKGREDRDVMLSPVLLEALREPWRRIKPKAWLFPAGRRHTAPLPLNIKTVWRACHHAVQRAGLNKSVHVHTLRHYLPLWWPNNSPISPSEAPWRSISVANPKFQQPSRDILLIP
jgi:site-specific recombinase XerD